MRELRDGIDAAAFASERVRQNVMRAMELIAKAGGGQLQLDVTEQMMRNDHVLPSVGLHKRPNRYAIVILQYSPYRPFAVRDMVTEKILRKFKSLGQALRWFPNASVSEEAMQAATADEPPSD